MPTPAERLYLLVESALDEQAGDWLEGRIVDTHIWLVASEHEQDHMRAVLALAVRLAATGILAIAERDGVEPEEALRRLVLGLEEWPDPSDAAGTAGPEQPPPPA